MAESKRIIASAPAAVAVAGATSDVSGKGGTLTLAIEGPNPAGDGGLRAYAMVAPGKGVGASVNVRGAHQVTADSLYGAGRLLEVAGYADSPPVAITLTSFIPPYWGLGGSAAQLVALLYALDSFFERSRPPEELAETVQRATLRPGQAHGYQKPYAATFGGVRYYGFAHKLTGLWGRGMGGIYDEPYAVVSEARDALWKALETSILVAIPKDISLVSGEINAVIAQRYREQDKDTVEAMDRKAFAAQLAHQRLVNGQRQGFWALVESDTAVMREWTLITQGHKEIMDLAHQAGAYASKPSNTGGAVIIYCPEGKEQAISDALVGVVTRVYPAQIAGGVRLEPRWPLE